MKILFFGQLSDKTGNKMLVRTFSGDLDALRKALEAEFPGLALQHTGVSVNQEIVRGNCLLKEDDEIAFMPPYAGG